MGQGLPNVLDAPRTTASEPLRRRAVGLVAAVLLIAGCSGSSAPAPRSAHGGLIAFTTTTGIHVVRADGTGLRWLTRYSGHYPPLPAWSSDGSRIVFDELQPGECECQIDIYVVRADGSGRRRLTRRGLNSAPAWSPDGKLIAFDGSNTISVASPDGSGQRGLTPEGVHGEPVWSHDGKQIAFRSFANGIYVMSADGHRLRRVAREGGDPVWSPDGRRIAFDHAVAGGCRCRNDIYSIAPSGRGLSRLTRGRSRSYEPAWSPEGGRIAFVGSCEFASGVCRDGSAIYVMDAHGNNARRITRQADNAAFPAWSPDGKRIAFVGARPCSPADCDQGLYVVNADGSGLQRVTRKFNPMAGTVLAWQPMSSRP